VSVIVNNQSVRLGGYPTARGKRELIAVRVDGEVAVFDLFVAAADEDGDRDERIVEEGLVTAAEIHALAREYLERAMRYGRPLVCAR
jgi:hypothetical protein